MTLLARNFLLAIGALALLTGVVVGIFWLRGMSGAPIAPSAQQAEQAGQAILVAAKPVKSGDLIRQEDLAWRAIGRANPPANSFVRTQVSETELVGAVARRSFASGEALTSDGVLRPTERGFLAATLSPGFRAVTIPVDAPQSASGLIQPGDHIDVILLSQPGDNRGRSVGQTVLADARVVAMGRSMSTSKAPDGQAVTAETPRTLTLEANPVDAERVLLAGQLGKLEIALRPLAQPDLLAAEARPVWAGDVLSSVGSGTASAKASAPARRIRARGPESLPPVQILRGSKTSMQ